MSNLAIDSTLKKVWALKERQGYEIVSINFAGEDTSITYKNSPVEERYFRSEIDEYQFYATRITQKLVDMCKLQKIRPVRIK